VLLRIFCEFADGRVSNSSEDLGALAMVQVSEQLAAEEKKEKRRRIKRLEDNVERKGAATMKSMDDVLEPAGNEGASAEGNQPFLC
jgi:hypothetical protein